MMLIIILLIYLSIFQPKQFLPACLNNLIFLLLSLLMIHFVEIGSYERSKSALALLMR